MTRYKSYELIFRARYDEENILCWTVTRQSGDKCGGCTCHLLRAKSSSRFCDVCWAEEEIGCGELAPIEEYIEAHELPGLTFSGYVWGEDTRYNYDGGIEIVEVTEIVE